jgi:RNA polymerase sigma-70 factor (ECF subfamily)
MTDFGELYKKYAPDVFRFALYLTGERSEAEDITSETFVRAWTSPEEIRVATVKGYLFTIARNLYRQSWRKKSRHVALNEDMRDPAASPETRAAAGAELQAVLAGLQQLPEEDRAALLMRANEGLSYEEISQAMGLSLASVKVKIHRARLALLKMRQV